MPSEKVQIFRDLTSAVFQRSRPGPFAEDSAEMTAVAESALQRDLRLLQIGA